MAVRAVVDAERRAADRAGVELRMLTELPDLYAVLDLVQRIWRPEPGHEPITIELLRAMTHAGNYAAGAYATARHPAPPPDRPVVGTLLGACVGFFAAPPGRTLHSHIAAVVPAAQASGVGLALKLHQRSWALAHGLSEVTWTFDPLVRRNAHFNLAKLGARPREYLIDFYGDLADGVNAGQSSDRLLVVWDLTATGDRPAQVEVDAAARAAVPALAVARAGGPEPAPAARWRTASPVVVGIPEDIEALRRRDPAAARAWRLAVRDVLGELLAGGAVVTGFLRTHGYLVERP